MSKSEKRLLIEKKQRELKLAGLDNKIMQFDIKILELEEEIERLEKNKQGSLDARVALLKEDLV
jgi:hypothetical protein